MDRPYRRALIVDDSETETLGQAVVELPTSCVIAVGERVRPVPRHGFGMTANENGKKR